MIRRLFMIMLMSIISLNLFAQTRVDGFDSYDAMIGKEVRLYNVVSMAEHQGYFAYDFDGSKPKLIKDDAIYRELQKNNIYVKEIVKHKKHSYLKVTVKGKSLYLILDDGFNYLANARSVSYWTEQNDRYVTLYSHLYAGSNIVAGDYKRIYPYVVLSKYIPITWCPIASMPENINDEVLFKFTISGRPMIEFALSNNIIECYKADFITKEQFDIEQTKYIENHTNNIDNDATIDVINNDKIDKNRVFEADIELTDSAKNILEEHNINYDLGFDLLFSVYCHTTKTTGTYSKTKHDYFKGFILGQEIELPSSAVIFRHEGDKEYLMARGDVGINTRRSVAADNNAKYSAGVLLWMDNYSAELQSKIDKTNAYYKKNGILILDQEYSFSDYRFGLKFNFYNCFSKDIKYIVLTVVGYNQVGDKERDDWGNHTKEARCIGPIKPTNTGVYDFNDLFKDEKDIIKELKVEKVVVTFMDNTTKTFSGKSNVDKLRLESYPAVNLNDDKPIKVGKATDFYDFVTGINWQWTEAELVSHLGYKIQRCKKDEWQDENSESNYKLDGITVCGIPIADSNIRVDKHTRKLYRMNLIVLDDATDLSTYPKIENALVAQFGAPIQKNLTDDRRDFIWHCDGYKIEATYWDLSNSTTKVVENYVYIVSIEPH